MCRSYLDFCPTSKKIYIFFLKVKLLSVLFFLMKPSKLSLGVTFVEECYSDTRFIALFYVKNEVSTETMFIFIFYCTTVSRENCMKLAVLFSDYFGIKNKTGWWFHDFKGHKIMKPPKSVGKKMKLTARGCAAAVSFIFFPDRLWTVS